MAAAKTGALLSCAASIGAVLAGADAAAVAALADFGTEVGLVVPGRRRHPRHLGRPGDHRQARRRRPRRQEEDAAGGVRHGGRARRARRRARRLLPQRRPRRGRGAPGDTTSSSGAAAARPPRSSPAQHLGAALAALDRADLDPAAAAELVAAGPVHLRASASDAARRPIDAGCAEALRRGRATRCSACSTPTAGGRASCRRTSRSTPRTCCCASSSASAPPRTADATATWIRAAAARRRHVGDVHRRPGRPVDDRRGVRRAAPGRRPADASHMEKAATFVRDAGGLERRQGVHPHLWLALGGQWSWDDLPSLPPEVILLPTWFPLNIYDFACWARQTIVALTVVGAHRPSRPLPFALDELRTGAPPPPRALAGARSRAASSCSTACSTATSAGRCAAAPHGDRPARSQWILARQEADGSWGGIQPPWVYSLLALHLEGFPLDHPAMRAGFDGLDRFTIDDDRGRRVECCQSPVWDTALAVIALADAGVPPDHPALVQRGRAGCSTRRSACPATGRCAGPTSSPAAGRSSSRTTTTPTSTTPPMVGARPAPRRPPRRRPGVGAAVPAGAAVAGGHAEPRRRLGRVRRRQHPRALPTAAVLRLRRGDRPAVGRRHRPRGRVARRRAAAPTGAAARRRRVAARRSRSADGSWFGRWGANHVYGTGAAVPALVAAGGHRYDRRGAAGRGVAGGAPEPRRRLGRGPALVPRPALARAGRVDGVADGVGAARRCSPPVERRRPWTAACAGWSGPSDPTAPGTSRGSPAPGSPATSTSTTTCTGRCSRSRRSAATWRGGDGDDAS